MKRCPDCDSPMLRKGQRRKHPEDYRHAQGCPRERPRRKRRTDKVMTDRIRTAGYDSGHCLKVEISCTSRCGHVTDGVPMTHGDGWWVMSYADLRRVMDKLEAARGKA